MKKRSSPTFTIGVDYGTNSVRALVVRTLDGAELGSAVVGYPSGAEGVLLDKRDHNLARQHPGDYLFGLERSVKLALAQARKRGGFDGREVFRQVRPAQPARPFERA
jgi:L-ribulokinase